MVKYKFGSTHQFLLTKLIVNFYLHTNYNTLLKKWKNDELL